MNTPASTASAITDEQIAIAWLRFRAWQMAGSPDSGPNNAEGYEVCEPGEKGDDGSDAFPVYDRAPTAQPTGQEAAGYFLRSGWSPKGDGTKLWEQVADEHKGDVDVVPLYERATVEPSQPARSEHDDDCSKIWWPSRNCDCTLSTAAPAAPSEDAKDAARYRWLRSKPLDWSVEHHLNGRATNYGRHELDQAIDAAIASSTNK